jgi:hypothetical protein
MQGTLRKSLFVSCKAVRWAPAVRMHSLPPNIELMLVYCSLLKSKRCAFYVPTLYLKPSAVVKNKCAAPHAHNATDFHTWHLQVLHLINKTYMSCDCKSSSLSLRDWAFPALMRFPRGAALTAMKVNTGWGCTCLFSLWELLRPSHLHLSSTQERERE